MSGELLAHFCSEPPVLQVGVSVRSAVAFGSWAATAVGEPAWASRYTVTSRSGCTAAVLRTVHMPECGVKLKLD